MNYPVLPALQQSLTDVPDTESDSIPDLGPKWEMSGQDTILAAGGEIIAQFWTVPNPKHAELMVSAPQLARLAELGKELAERAKGTMGPSLRYLGSDYLEAYAAVMEGGQAS